MPPRIRSILASFAIATALQGLVWGSVQFASLPAHSLARWLAVVTASSLYSGLAGLPTALGCTVLLARVHRWATWRRFAVAFVAFAPLTAAGWLIIALAYPGGSMLARLPSVLGITTTYFLVTFVQSVQARFLEEALAREQSMRLAFDAQLSSLESKIRPHFLFNALNSVLALIPDDPKRATEVLERITGLLRASLHGRSGDLVPLRDEMDLVTDYLEIERVRFGERLRYALAVPPDLDAVVVPAFSIQTLVENAVKYAVAKQRDGAHIHVTAATTHGGRVAVTVTDDGPGFDVGVLPPGHGLEALRVRLDLLFGRTGMLEIAGNTGGARVVMHVPMKREAA